MTSLTQTVYKTLDSQTTDKKGRSCKMFNEGLLGEAALTTPLEGAALSSLGGEGFSRISFRHVRIHMCCRVPNGSHSGHRAKVDLTKHEPRPCLTHHTKCGQSTWQGLWAPCNDEPPECWTSQPIRLSKVSGAVQLKDQIV